MSSRFSLFLALLINKLMTVSKVSSVVVIELRGVNCNWSHEATLKSGNDCALVSGIEKQLSESFHSGFNVNVVLLGPSTIAWRVL